MDEIPARLRIGLAFRGCRRAGAQPSCAQQGLAELQKCRSDGGALGIDSILPPCLASALDLAAAYGLPGMCWEPLLPRYGNFRLQRQLLHSCVSKISVEPACVAKSPLILCCILGFSFMESWKLRTGRSLNCNKLVASFSPTLQFCIATRSFRSLFLHFRLQAKRVYYESIQ